MPIVSNDFLAKSFNFLARINNLSVIRSQYCVEQNNRTVAAEASELVTALYPEVLLRHRYCLTFQLDKGSLIIRSDKFTSLNLSEKRSTQKVGSFLYVSYELR